MGCPLHQTAMRINLYMNSSKDIYFERVRALVGKVKIMEWARHGDESGHRTFRVKQWFYWGINPKDSEEWDQFVIWAKDIVPFDPTWIASVRMSKQAEGIVRMLCTLEKAGIQKPTIEAGIKEWQLNAAKHWKVFMDEKELRPNKGKGRTRVAVEW